MNRRSTGTATCTRSSTSSTNLDLVLDLARSSSAVVRGYMYSRVDASRRLRPTAPVHPHHLSSLMPSHHASVMALDRLDDWKHKGPQAGSRQAARSRRIVPPASINDLDCLLLTSDYHGYTGNYCTTYTYVCHTVPCSECSECSVCPQ